MNGTDSQPSSSDTDSSDDEGKNEHMGSSRSIPPSFGYGYRYGYQYQYQFKPTRPPPKSPKKTLVSHPLVSYATLFRPYSTADVLIVDACRMSRELVKAKVGRVVIRKSVVAPRSVGEGNEPPHDEGRNVFANECVSQEEAFRRLVENKETYAVVFVREESFVKGRGGTSDTCIVAKLRNAGYKGAIAKVMTKCTVQDSWKAREEGANACLVLNTGTFEPELGNIVRALVMRYPKTN